MRNASITCAKVSVCAPLGIVPSGGQDLGLRDRAVPIVDGGAFEFSFRENLIVCMQYHFPFPSLEVLASLPFL